MSAVPGPCKFRSASRAVFLRTAASTFVKIEPSPQYIPGTSLIECPWSYSALLIPLSFPVFVLFVYLNWFGRKLFIHN